MISPWLFFAANAMFVSWDAPPECISLEELRTRVEAEYVWENAKIRRQLRGRVEANGLAWRVTLQVYEDGKHLGDRVLELDDPHCRAHDETITLVSALLLEHGHAPSPEPGRAPEPAVSKRSSDEQPTSPPSFFFRGRAFASFSTTFFWTPQPAYGPGGALGIGLGRYIWVDLTGSYLAPRESQAGGLTLRTQGGRAGVRACTEFSSERWFTDLCVGGGWIGLSASGIDAEENRTTFFSTAEFGANWLGGINLNPWWAIFGEASLGFPLQRGRFVLLNGEVEEELFRTNMVLPALNVGIRLTF